MLGRSRPRFRLPNEAGAIATGTPETYVARLVRVDPSQPTATVKVILWAPPGPARIASMGQHGPCLLLTPPLYALPRTSPVQLAR